MQLFELSNQALRAYPGGKGYSNGQQYIKVFGYRLNIIQYILIGERKSYFFKQTQKKLSQLQHCQLPRCLM